ncbi:RNA polymerase sigma factor [Niabella drilacis]|uniref:RNA polymerase sigma-70 factor, ECF subfamily n=1 Tax=Niabella drilacis (strain DSM 25811 / CCM 8410 / CCUG 62505 / LMG 26954 / E90) TaxID=1285928 RepID=A0A1G6VRS4_NIADE|nr:sigma-70 family RNA polymerase sigma factor [Niabella drilacis]SDD56278.1 RNA polymerase sigma-70 factor, ECF subfamily [Niabella drilacis]
MTNIVNHFSILPFINQNKNVPQSEAFFLASIQQHAGILHKVARMYMDQPEDREDLHQEMIIQLWKSYPGFKGDSRFSTWMYRVAINTAITFLRKEQTYKKQVTYTGIPDAADEGPPSHKETQLNAFYKAAQELNPVEKAVIFYFMEGLSHKEIGQQLGISEGNARVRLNRTKEKLQTIIKKQGYEF